MQHNFSYYIATVFIFFGMGCVQSPTKVIEQSADIYEKNIVLLDTRDALSYASYHIEGSKNLLVEDFLVLKNPLAKTTNKKYTFDPDINQTIERLAHKGVSPNKRIYLIGDVKNSVSNKKWKWLLSYLDIKDIALFSLAEVKKIKNGRFSEAEKQSPWVLKSSVEFQNEFVFKNTKKCFVGWSDKSCK